MMAPLRILSVLACALASVAAQDASAASVGSAAGADASLQGFAKESMNALNSAMAKWVDDKKGANVVTLLARKGKIVNFEAVGVLDASAAQKVPVQQDSIFRIMSMTKPVVGVAMMMMYEAGKWNFDDPVTKHIPEFASLKVKEGTRLVEPNKPITMAMIVSHSAGFGNMLTVDSPTLSGIIPPLVKANLAFQPGRDWRYGPGVEIQGYLIEKWAGKDLSDFMEERIFKPLNMSDTGFFIDPSKVPRVVSLHSAAGGTLKSVSAKTATSKPKRLSPSGGLLSTAMDYFKFSEMLLERGSLNGVQLLKPETVDLMHKNLLEPGVGVGLNGASPTSTGFGVDFAIIREPKDPKNNVPVNSYYWGGAYGTWFWIDPDNEVVFVGMIQNQGNGAGQLSGDLTLRQQAAKALYAGMQK